MTESKMPAFIDTVRLTTERLNTMIVKAQNGYLLVPEPIVKNKSGLGLTLA